MYQQLLERLDSALEVGPRCSLSTISDPFLAILQSVREADTIPPYMREEYPNVVYWTKVEYLKDHQNGRGTLWTTRTPNSGTFGYLESEEGIVLCKDEQQKYRDYFKPILYTLLQHNLAPMTWTKCTALAREYFIRSMRTKFTAFRLCADDWKADMLMSTFYSHWSDRPRDPEVEAMGVKEEGDMSFPETLSRANSKTRKRSQSVSTALSPHPDKRKKAKPLDPNIDPSLDGAKDVNDRALTSSSEVGASGNEGGIPITVSPLSFTLSEFILKHIHR